MKYAYLLLVAGALLMSARMVMDIANEASGPRVSAAETAASASDAQATVEPQSTYVEPAVAERIEQLLKKDQAADSATESSPDDAGLTTTVDSKPAKPAKPADTVDASDPSPTVSTPRNGIDQLNPSTSEVDSLFPTFAPTQSQSPITAAPQPGIRQEAPLHPQMLTPGNFEYLGAFRTPLADVNDARFTYGGWGVTFRKNGDTTGENDGHPGSLFIVGHRHHQLVAEIAIPRPVISKDRDINDLPVARVIQPLSDVTGGIRNQLSGDSSEPFEVGGMQVVGNSLHWTLYKYYNVEGHDYYSHGMSTLDLNQPKARGLWHLGPPNSGDPRWHSYKHGGYLCEVPEPFRKYLGGRNMLSGLQISTGRTYSSQGPSLFAYTLTDQAPRNGAALNAAPMLWYPMQSRVAAHHGADLWKGAAWLTLGDKQVIAFVGRKAHGPERYGPATAGDCYDYKGYHGDSYEAQMLFYAPGDLVNATNRAVADVQPWYRWDAGTPGGSLNRFMFQKCGKEIGGMAYDRENQLIYISEIDAGYAAENEWEVLPVVHVLRLVE